MKILVCDDADVMRRIHINILMEHGINPNDIIQAGNGKEALEKIEGNTIRLFLIDWNMPNLNGFELVQKIRTMDQYKTTPIVMVTAEGGRYNVMEAIEAGVTNYVLKPIKADILWSKIKPYLE
ncbi:response regulator [Breznakiella homolactica]|uniref:Response regulator n=1 Tax=Breznakiella homolactica TaxID=2798577 RepID=A0A7T7XRK1_9SPIR|nr:response regulator [Breznakiella homolactica]QQO11201.1 response regulator [Breznakiella homolactica]